MSTEADSLVPEAPPEHQTIEFRRFYIFFDIALLLGAFTLIEWVMATLPWNYWVLAIPLAVLSIFKFIGVIVWFMHLRWDHRLCTIIFLGGLLIATATVTALLIIFESPPPPPEEPDPMYATP